MDRWWTFILFCGTGFLGLESGVLTWILGGFRLSWTGLGWAIWLTLLFIWNKSWSALDYCEMIPMMICGMLVLLRWFGFGGCFRGHTMIADACSCWIECMGTSPMSLKYPLLLLNCDFYIFCFYWGYRTLVGLPSHVELYGPRFVDLHNQCKQHKHNSIIRLDTRWLQKYLSSCGTASHTGERRLWSLWWECPVSDIPQCHVCESTSSATSLITPQRGNQPQ